MTTPKSIIEALLFAAPEPLTQARLNAIIPDEELDLAAIVEELNFDYLQQNKAITIAAVAGGYQILTIPEVHLYVQRLLNKTRRLQITPAAMEALAIIAYKQPVSKLELESIRGVGCDSVVRSLLEKELITIKGRDPGIGRALLYGTTQQFLEAFGLNSLQDLPRLKELSELMAEEPSPEETNATE